MTKQPKWKGFGGPKMPWEDNLVFSRIADQRGTLFAYKVWNDLQVFVAAGVTPLVPEYRVSDLAKAETALDIYKVIRERDGEEYMLQFYQTMRLIRMLGQHVAKVHRCKLPPGWTTA